MVFKGSRAGTTLGFEMTLPFLKVEKRKRERSTLVMLLGWAFGAGALMLLAGSAGAGYIIWKFSKDLPDYASLAKYEPPVMTRIHASNGSLVREYAHQKRIYVPINTIPKRVIQAFLSAEDKNFFEHGGIDFQGVAKAVLQHVAFNKPLRGASTITQQVAKNFLLTNERSFERKIKEAILSLRIEKAFSKEKILELYLNEIYLGYLQSYGVAAAALNYFGKELEELSVAEVAYLAALPKAPNNYHPFKKRKAAVIRRNWVIGQMRDNGFITPNEAEEAINSPLAVTPRPFGARLFAAEFFAEEVRRQLVDMYGDDKVLGGGLSVRTTLNPAMQRMARRALVKGLVAYDRRKGWRGPVEQIDISNDWGIELAKLEFPNDIQPWQMAVVLAADAQQARIGLRPKRLANGQLSADRDTGIITRAEVKWTRPKGGRVDRRVAPGDVVYVEPAVTKDKKDKNGNVIAAPTNQWRLMQIPQVEGGIVAMDPHTGRVHAMVGGFSFARSTFNRATQAKRQPGSSFKPFVYAAALDNGYKPTSVVLDAPIAIDQGNGQGIWKPENYGKKFYGPSTLRLGIERSRNLMTVRLTQDMGMPLIVEYARRFGIYDNLLPVLSMALGAGETTLLRMVNAYAMLANGGKKVEASVIDRIQDRFGRTIWRHDKRECVGCIADEWRGQDEPVIEDNRTQIIDPHTAYQMTSIMEGVVQRGTATRVKTVGKPIAGKTGTTNEEKDAWFVGYSPDMVVGVYIGFDNPKPMGKGETGGALASPIFSDFMKQALADQPAIPFRIPPGIKLVRVNRKTGLRSSSGDRESILEAFKPDNEPDDVYSAIGYTSGFDGGGGTSQPIGTGRGVY